MRRPKGYAEPVARGVSQAGFPGEGWKYDGEGKLNRHEAAVLLAIALYALLTYLAWHYFSPNHDVHWPAGAPGEDAISTLLVSYIGAIFLTWVIVVLRRSIRMPFVLLGAVPMAVLTIPLAIAVTPFL